MAARSLDEESAWPLVRAIQRAFYAEGRDVTQAAVLAGLAEAVGLPRIEFAAAFDSGEARDATAADFAWVRTSASPGSRPCWPNATANWRCSPTATSRLPNFHPCSAAGWNGAGMSERGDRLSWAEIRRLALRHKKALLFANLVAVLATLCTVPIPLLLPLLVDEVLLGKGDGALRFMDRLLPADWQVAFGYIGLMLAATLLLRGRRWYSTCSRRSCSRGCPRTSSTASACV